MFCFVPFCFALQMALAVVLRASILTFQQFHCAWLMKFMCIYFTLTSHPTPFPLPKPLLFFFFYGGVHSCVTLGRNSDFHLFSIILSQSLAFCCCSWFRDSCIITCIVSARLYVFTASEWVYSYARHINQIRNANAEFAITGNSSSSITTAANVKHPKMLIWLSCCVDGHTTSPPFHHPPLRKS